MGYGHSWEWIQNPDPNKVEGEALPALCELFGQFEPIVGPMDPVILDHHINGHKIALEHIRIDAPGSETFLFPGRLKGETAPEHDEPYSGWNGLKTDHGSEDMIFLAALLAIKAHFGEDVRIKSDAYWHYEWMHGRQFRWGDRRCSRRHASPLAIHHRTFDGALTLPWEIHHPYLDLSRGDELGPLRLVVELSGLRWQPWLSGEGYTIDDAEVEDAQIQNLERSFNADITPLQVSRRDGHRTFYECKVRLPIENPLSVDLAYLLASWTGRW